MIHVLLLQLSIIRPAEQKLYVHVQYPTGRSSSSVAAPFGRKLAPSGRLLIQATHRCSVLCSSIEGFKFRFVIQEAVMFAHGIAVFVSIMWFAAALPHRPSLYIGTVVSTEPESPVYAYGTRIYMTFPCIGAEVFTQMSHEL